MLALDVTDGPLPLVTIPTVVITSGLVRIFGVTVEPSSSCLLR